MHADVVVDVLEPGECFGHPSLLSGMAPAFTVRGAQRPTCVLVPARCGAAECSHTRPGAYIAPVPATPARPDRAHRARLPDLSLRAAGALVHRRPARRRSPPRPCARSQRPWPGRSERRRSRRRPDGLDRDRPRPARPRPGHDARARSPSRSRCAPRPSSSNARAAARRWWSCSTTTSASLCVMIAQATCAGVVERRGVAGGERSPFALRRDRCGRPDARRSHRGLARDAALVASLLSAGCADGVSRCAAVQSDAATSAPARAVGSRAPAQLPRPGHGWRWEAWPAASSRSASDQDNALAYGDDAGGDGDAFFARVGRRERRPRAVRARRRQRRGARRDHRGGFPPRRMDRGVPDCLEHPDRWHLVRAAVAFDFRKSSARSTSCRRSTRSLREARASSRTSSGALTRTATDWRVPISAAVDTLRHRPGRARGPEDASRCRSPTFARFYALGRRT